MKEIAVIILGSCILTFALFYPLHDDTDDLQYEISYQQGRHCMLQEMSAQQELGVEFEDDFCRHGEDKVE